MHLSTERKSELLHILVETEGFPSLEAMLEATLFDSVSPAICRHCELTTEMEPDQTRGWCEHCGTSGVIAAPILADII